MNKRIFSLLIICVLLAGCDDLFSPAIENNRGLDPMYEEAIYAQGILFNGYTRVPTNSWSFNDVATDDAVSNDKFNGYMKMATGQWTSYGNPVETWRNCRAAIQYLNILLANSDKVKWSKNPNTNRMFNDRHKGEAYGLRAMFMFYLLQAHAGNTDGGELLGIPIVLDPEDKNSDFNRPRATFEACMKQLDDDIKEAIELLPANYNNINSVANMPAKYADDGISTAEYNDVFGEYARQRMNATIAKAIRAKAALLAASPAFNPENSKAKWALAANYAGELIDLNNGLGGIAGDGWKWYANNGEINGLQGGANPKEIIWRTNSESSSSLEKDHFPPTLFGNGRLNPTQNLVDAFPMKNGYPITHSGANYSSQDPYKDRDPRLEAYIVFNGSKAGHESSTIKTEVDGGTNDGLNKVETSTRTGYYMRKLLRQDVNLNPTSVNAQKHYKPHIRYTEIYLIYAEAANEAWGPEGTGGFGFSARDVIKAIRARAGVGADNGDPYLASITTTADMTKLIRNERRLELCFEGFRFWDLRRWGEDLTEEAKGMQIQSGVHSSIPVEKRTYEDYMQYGPIPYSEVLKFSELKQNAGW